MICMARLRHAIVHMIRGGVPAKRVSPLYLVVNSVVTCLAGKPAKRLIISRKLYCPKSFKTSTEYQTDSPVFALRSSRQFKYLFVSYRLQHGGHSDFAVRKGLERPQNHKGLVYTITRELVIQTIQKERQTHLKTLIESSEFQRPVSFASTTVTDLVKPYLKRNEAVPNIRHKPGIYRGQI